MLTPILHDTPGEIAQAFDVKDWKRGEIEPIPGKTMPAVTVVERDYPEPLQALHLARPADGRSSAMAARAWPGTPSTRSSSSSAQRRGHARRAPTKGLARIDTDIDASEVILSAGAGDQRRGRGQGLGGARQGSPAASTRISPCRRRTRRSASATSSRSRARSSPRRSGRGWRCEKVCYNAGYTNVHELIPWRTLTGRQQLYQDHLWMRAFGEGFCVYRPPIDTQERSSR